VTRSENGVYQVLEPSGKLRAGAKPALDDEFVLEGLRWMLLSRAFDSWIVPLLGFFLLPWTTLAYAAFWDWGPGHHVTGFEWFFVILAFLIDVSSYASGRRAQTRRSES